jgi:hypothetical protein
LVRVSQVLEKSKGFDKSTTDTKYLGSPQKNIFQVPLYLQKFIAVWNSGDKDAERTIF